jgi:hypothetical protein
MMRMSGKLSMLTSLSAVRLVSAARALAAPKLYAGSSRSLCVFFSLFNVAE